MGGKPKTELLLDLILGCEENSSVGSRDACETMERRQVSSGLYRYETTFKVGRSDAGHLKAGTVTGVDSKTSGSLRQYKTVLQNLPKGRGRNTD